MFVEDLKKDFYNLLLGKRVFMAVQTGVDAACAAYALAGLLRGAGVAHSVAGVRSAAEAAARAGGEAAAPVLLLVGCGATEDLAALLQPPPEQIIFVLDSHRPSHVCNVYSDGQIRLLYRDPDEDIPDFDDIFRDDSDDEDDELDNMTDLEARAAAATRRRERAGWERKRHELMFNYTQFTYFATPMAVIASELCWQVGVAKQAAWATCVSLAHYRGTALRAQAQCALDEHRIHHALRHPDIAVSADAWVPLYREWSIYGALANHLNVPLAPLLADMGYPLAQAKQAFCAMDVELRNKFVTSLEAVLQRRGLPPASHPARVLRRPHARARSALDDAVALMALCEHSCPDRALQQSFSCLGGDAGARGTGLELAKGNITAITQLAQHYSFNRNPPAMFLHLTLECSISSRLRGPIWLREVARRVRKKLPTVVSCDRPDGTCLMIGLPPSSDTRNIFGAAFDQAASESNVTIWREYADAELVTMKSEHRNSFVDALTALLS